MKKTILTLSLLFSFIFGIAAHAEQWLCSAELHALAPTAFRYHDYPIDHKSNLIVHTTMRISVKRDTLEKAVASFQYESGRITLYKNNKPLVNKICKSGTLKTFGVFGTNSSSWEGYENFFSSCAGLSENTDAMEVCKKISLPILKK